MLKETKIRGQISHADKLLPSADSSSSKEIFHFALMLSIIFYAVHFVKSVFSMLINIFTFSESLKLYSMADITGPV